MNVQQHTLTVPYMLQVSIPLWALVHLPVVVTVTTAIFTPQGWLHCILYVLFENAMGIVKLGAVIAGESNQLNIINFAAASRLVELQCAFAWCMSQQVCITPKHVSSHSFSV